MYVGIYIACDTNHRHLLQVEMEKKIQIICENDVDNEFGSYDYGDSKFHLPVDNNCHDDFVDSEFNSRPDNDFGGNIYDDFGDYVNAEIYGDTHFYGVFIVSNGESGHKENDDEEI